jgi:hypothetical protein
MQGSLGHCPELVEVKFFFLVQLAEMSKKSSSPAATARPRWYASTVPVGDWWMRVRVLDDDRERDQQLAAETKNAGRRGLSDKTGLEFSGSAPLTISGSSVIVSAMVERVVTKR